MSGMGTCHDDSGDGGRSEPIDVAWSTATGPRAENQDRAATSPLWAVVSDGAGGLPGGATAARLTTEAAVANLAAAIGPLDDSVVARAIAAADRAVRAQQAADERVATMAATLTIAAAAAVEPAGSTWLVANLGDSPAWLVAGGHISRVSQEDNVAAELVRAGALSAEEARGHPGRHIVTRAVGTGGSVAVSPTTVRLGPGDHLVLASDGVEVLAEEAIMEVVAGAPDAHQAARRLVDAALGAGATDNVTVAVVRHRTAGGGRGCGGTG
jgi:protein phosphatase